MSTLPRIPDDELVEIPSPYVEPRLAFQALEPRKVNNLTLIDGKVADVERKITPRLRYSLGLSQSFKDVDASGK